MSYILIRICFCCIVVYLGISSICRCHLLFEITNYYWHIILTIFICLCVHMLYNFGYLSVHALVHHIQFVLLLRIKRSLNIWTNSMVFLRYVYGKYFLPVFSSSFYFNKVFHKATSLDINEVYSLLAVYFLSFCCCIKENHWQFQTHLEFFLCFPSDHL